MRLLLTLYLPFLTCCLSVASWLSLLLLQRSRDAPGVMPARRPWCLTVVKIFYDVLMCFFLMFQEQRLSYHANKVLLMWSGVGWVG